MTKEITPLEGPDVAALGRRAAEAKTKVEELSNLEIEVDDLDPVEQKDILNTARAEMLDAQEQLIAATQELEAAFKAQMLALKTELAPLEKKAKEMKQAVDAINIYLGTDEDIILIRDGEQAPADTPIHVYQHVLFMDEEIALSKQIAQLDGEPLSPGEKGWKTFDEWLLADEANLNQVLPARKGVVGFRSARENRSNDPYKVINGDGSEVSHLLIRNGDQLSWLIISYDMSLGDRLVPTVNEFEKFFYDKWEKDEHGNPKRLTPGSRQWSTALEQSQTTQRHFLKIALALQGVVDRHTVLAPLPCERVWFTRHESYDAGHIVLVTDEKQLPDGIMPYEQWRSVTTQEADIGTRVVLGRLPWNDSIEDRIKPKWADGPPLEVPLELKRRRNGELYVSWKRTDKVWKRNVPIPDKPGWVYKEQLVDSDGWATCTVGLHEGWVLPIDHPEVTLEAIDWYLRSRDSRRHFLSMVPLLLSAKSVLEQEAEWEAPFRELLASTLTNKYEVDKYNLEELADHVIYWWKTKNKSHRALIVGDEQDDKAFVEILAEIDKRITIADMHDDPAILEEVSKTVPNPLWVGRNLKGEYVAIEASNDQKIYVNVHTWTAKRGNYKGVSEWVVRPDIRSWRAISDTGTLKEYPRFVDKRIEPTGPMEVEIIQLIKDKHPEVLLISRSKMSSYRSGYVWVYELYEPGTPPTFEKGKPLTGDNCPGTFQKHDYRWELVNGEVELEKRNYAEGKTTRITSSNLDWITKFSDESRRYKSRESLCWADESEFNSYVSKWGAAWEEHGQVEEPLRELITKSMTLLEEAWVSRQQEVEYRLFLTKYGKQAAGRWDAHLATIKNSRLRFPHGNKLRDFLTIAVEKGFITNDIEVLFDDLVGLVKEPILDVETVEDLSGLRFKCV